LQSGITVAIDADIYAYLRSQSTFEDTVSTVLRRELKLPTPDSDATPAPPETDGGGETMRDVTTASRPASSRATSKRQKTKRRRAAAGTLLPESEYIRPILEAIAEAGGTAPKQAVIEAVGKKLAGRLTKADHEELDSGGIRWQSRIQFARLRLVDRGLIEKNAPRGTWAITPEGTKALEEGAV
jgi:hypothetical protein